MQQGEQNFIIHWRKKTTEDENEAQLSLSGYRKMKNGFVLEHLQLLGQELELPAAG